MYVESVVYHADGMLEPGAKTSTQLPKFEYDACALSLSVAPTVSADLALPGENAQAYVALFPAAAATLTPAATAFSTAWFTISL